MKKNYQEAAQQLCEFVMEGAGLTKAELRAELETEGVKVDEFLAKFAKAAGIQTTPHLPDKKPMKSRKPIPEEIAKEFASLHFRQGVDRFQNNDFVEAAKSFESASKLDQGHHDAIFDLALTQLIREQFDEAWANIFRVCSIEKPTRADTLLLMAKIAAKTNELDNLFEKLNVNVRVSIDDGELQLLADHAIDAADNAIDAMENQVAITLAEFVKQKAEERRKKKICADVLYALGLAFINTCRYDEAVPVLRQSADLYKSAQLNYDAAWSVAKLAEAGIWLAASQGGNANYDSIHKALDEAEKLAQKVQKKGENRTLIGIPITRAEALLAEGRVEQVEKAISLLSSVKIDQEANPRNIAGLLETLSRAHLALLSRKDNSQDDLLVQANNYVAKAMEIYQEQRCLSGIQDCRRTFALVNAHLVLRNLNEFKNQAGKMLLPGKSQMFDESIEITRNLLFSLEKAAPVVYSRPVQFQRGETRGINYILRGQQKSPTVFVASQFSRWN
jgi:tetratricopeptide (TPR) repeat protein